MSLKPLSPQDRFSIMKQLGNGSFGTIYSAIDNLTSEKVALKIENEHVLTSLINMEAEAYLALQGGPGIPKFYWFGQYNKNQRGMAIQLIDQSLRDIVVKCHNQLSLKSTLMLAERFITTVQYIHSKGYIHRDLKPENFLLDKNNNFYIIDYGLCTKYITSTGEHIPYREGLSLIGTPIYASMNACQGRTQSRRDDLESIGYILIHLIKGTLPWSKIAKPQNPDDRRAYIQKILDCKLATGIEDLCSGLPDQFVQYFDEVELNLGFEDTPDYEKLKGFFKEALTSSQLKDDGKFDWDVSKPAAKSLSLHKTRTSLNTSSSSLEKHVPTPRSMRRIRQSPSNLISPHPTKSGIKAARSSIDIFSVNYIK